MKSTFPSLHVAPSSTHSILYNSQILARYRGPNLYSTIFACTVMFCNTKQRVHLHGWHMHIPSSSQLSYPWIRCHSIICQLPIYFRCELQKPAKRRAVVSACLGKWTCFQKLEVKILVRVGCRVVRIYVARNKLYMSIWRITSFFLFLSSC